MRLGEEATLSNIAEQLTLEIHSISAQLTRMEKEGLIEKTKDRKKKNLMHVRITDKGYESFIHGMKREKLNSIMSALTDEEKHSLWMIIAKIREKSMAELGKESKNLYPPSDPADLPPPSQQEGTMQSVLLHKSPSRTS